MKCDNCGERSYEHSYCDDCYENLQKENEELKLMLGVILQSHIKGHSELNEPIVKRVKELLKYR